MRFSDYNDSLKNICLSELLSFQNGINADSDKYGKGIKYISVGDIINNDYITYDCIKGKVDISQKELNNYLVENGDILFQRSSETFEDIGNANVYLDEQPCTFGGFVIRGKKIGEYDPKYLNYLLKSPNARKQVIRLGAGAQHYNINQESLNKIFLSFPSAKEQEKISRFLTKIEEQIQLQNKIIEEYKTLKDSLNKRLIDNSKGNFTLENYIVSNTSNLKESDVLNSKNGIYPVYGANGIIKYIDKYDIDQCSISIVKDGAGVGRLQYHEGKYSIIGTLNYLTSKGLFDLKYIYYAMKNINFKNYVVGTGIPHIYFKDYKKEKIKITTNEEIDKIVKILTDIDEYIYLQEKLLDKLMIEKKFFLNNLFV
ncbi:MAG: restriction endonuclease subunit S [Candidatus Onthovivens sp.]